MYIWSIFTNIHYTGMCCIYIAPDLQYSITYAGGLAVLLYVVVMLPVLNELMLSIQSHTLPCCFIRMSVLVSAW